MYSVAVRRDFVAQHYLLGGNDGPENSLHSHDYRVEVQLEGSSLDEYGYLVDIVVIKDGLEALLSKYRDQTLNDTPEFDGLNPSVEHFARIMCEGLFNRIRQSGLMAITVKMWEDENAWAAFRQEW
jgi:6-pyruvoyltetrahydropterin/6-carboxytetrahydropterin synthase